MTKEQILSIIDKKYTIVSEDTKSNGICLKLNNGAIINCFNNGNHNVEDRDFEKPSDIQGLVYIPFSNKVDEVTVNLVKELSNQGYSIDNKKL